MRISRSPESLRRAKARLTVALALLLPLAVPAEDWPQWRGLNRDGVWNETSILQSFPAKGLKIRWRIPVGPEIDALPYALYGLTPEEIEIVESASAEATARQGSAQK